MVSIHEQVCQMGVKIESFKFRSFLRVILLGQLVVCAIFPAVITLGTVSCIDKLKLNIIFSRTTDNPRLFVLI